MAENKKSFLLYCDIIHTVKKMPKEKAGELFIHILEYVNDLNPQTDDLLINISFEPIKQQLKRDLKKYQSTCDKNRENALKRWNNKNATASERMPTDAKNADIDTDNDTDNDTDKDIENKNNYIPSFEIFKTYVLENEPNVDIKALELKYKSWIENDWKDGNNRPIKKWKSKILNTLQYLPKKEIKSTKPKLSI